MSTGRRELPRESALHVQSFATACSQHHASVSYTTQVITDQKCYPKSSMTAAIKVLPDEVPVLYAYFHVQIPGSIDNYNSPTPSADYPANDLAFSGIIGAYALTASMCADIYNSIRGCICFVYYAAGPNSPTCYLKSATTNANNALVPVGAVIYASRRNSASSPTGNVCPCSCKALTCTIACEMSCVIACPTAPAAPAPKSKSNDCTAACVMAIVLPIFVGIICVAVVVWQCMVCRQRGRAAAAAAREQELAARGLTCVRFDAGAGACGKRLNVRAPRQCHGQARSGAGSI